METVKEVQKPLKNSMQQVKANGVMLPLMYVLVRVHTIKRAGLLKGDALDQSNKWQPPAGSLNESNPANS